MLQDVLINNKYLDTIDTIEESLVSYYHENFLFKDNFNNREITLREFDCWQGRADLVSAKVNGDFSLSLKQVEILTNLTNAQVLSLLHYKSPRTFKFIKNRLALTDQTIKKAIRNLINNEMVEVTAKGNFLLNSNFILPKVEFNAYEVKLQNWKRALYQSTQYFGFSHYSWVIMPERYIKPALKNGVFFEANGVGLIGIDPNGTKTIYIRASKNQPRKKAFYLVGVGKVMKNYLNMV